MSQFAVNGSATGSALQNILMADDIVPGSAPSYQACKEIFLYHPLGRKMAEGPVAKAQSQARAISVPDSPEDRVVTQFRAQWVRDQADKHIRDVCTLARVYGVSSLALMCDKVEPEKPVPYEKLHELSISFSVFDPLNTAGSLVLNQNTDAMDFMKVANIAVNGKRFHPSRASVTMNEQPVYIAYTTSAFGFVGRSVYQRALFPLKTFLQTMLTDDLVTVKAGVLVAKLQSPGSIVDNLMSKLFGLKRDLIKQAATGNVLSVGHDDAIESLNFQNLEGPAAMARTNVLKNIATAADMPAVMLENETLTEGFGEGSEDAKIIANYIDGIRRWMEPQYQFMTRIIQHRAWTPGFYETIQADFPEWKAVDYRTAFYRWVNSFQAEWPSLLTEPESERTKVDETKLKAIVSMLEVLLPRLDPENRATLIQWAADNFNDLKLLFTNPLVLDSTLIAEYQPQAEDAGESGGGPMAFADSTSRLRRIAGGQR
jgi:Protein of unknown function (DUF1073)